MANINELLARAAALRDETALNSISPERAGGIMYDTLLAMNELWLQQGAALVISKIYASVAAMEADTAPVSDLTGQPLRPGQIVVIASSDSDNGSVYRYNGTSSPSWSLVGEIGNLEPVDSLDSDSTSLPLAAHQGKVLDGKISQLGQETSLLGINGIYAPSQDNVGYYRRYDSAIGANQYYFYTNPIQVEAGDVICTSAPITLSASVAFITEVDENGDYISVLLRGKNGDNNYYYLCEKDGYISISAIGLDVSSIHIISSNIWEEILSSLSGYIGEEKSLIGIKDNVFPAADNNGYYYHKNGYIAPNGSYSYSNPMLVKRGWIFKTESEITSANSVSLITEVDENGKYISSILQGQSGDNDYYHIFNKDCYVVFSSITTEFGKFYIIKDDLSLNIGQLTPRVDEASIETIVSNPLENIIRDCGYGSILHSWGIIGDSLSSGEMDIYVGGVHNRYVDMYEYSWGQRFAKLICAKDVWNFSNGGQTAKGWINGGIVHDSTYEGGIGGGGWQYAKLQENLKQAYVIALGVNDLNQSYGIGSVLTDIGTYDSVTDTDTNADSFVGYYAGIIQRIKSIQPMAKIFCVTPQVDDDLSQAIRDLVEYYSANSRYPGDVWLVDFDRYSPIRYSNQTPVYKLNSHLSAYGYQYFAYLLNTYIDWIIRNNGLFFRKVALIGLSNVE